MYYVGIQMRCQDSYTDMTPSDLDTARILIEVCISLALKELFSEIEVDTVDVRHLPDDAGPNGMLPFSA